MKPALTLAPDSLSVGTFVKTDSTQTVEILGLCGLDFVVLDAEHAPFGRRQMDAMLLAARAVGLPMLVRVPDRRDATILNALDLGAAGLIVPHVDSPSQARDLLAAARFVGGRRGLSLSARFADYGTVPRGEAIAAADRAIIVCQIESPAAVEAVFDIAAEPGVAGLLIGRSDLALSMGVDSPGHVDVMRAVQTIVAAARQHRKSVMVALGRADEMAEFAAVGATSFIVGSDQSLLRDAAAQLRPAMKVLPPILA